MQNFVQIPKLDSEKPPTCHNGDTICRTKNRIPRCKPQTITRHRLRSTHEKIKALRLRWVTYKYWTRQMLRYCIIITLRTNLTQFHTTQLKHKKKIWKLNQRFILNDSTLWQYILENDEVITLVVWSSDDDSTFSYDCK